MQPTPPSSSPSSAGARTSCSTDASPTLLGLRAAVPANATPAPSEERPPLPRPTLRGLPAQTPPGSGSRAIAPTVALPKVSAEPPRRDSDDAGVPRRISTGSLRGTIARLDDDAESGRPATPRVRLVPGQQIPGTRYRIDRWLGEGGMGEVFEATHVDIQRKVALKLLKFGTLEAEELERRFLAEARAIAKVDSPFVVDVLDFGELPDGRPFYAMELLEPRSALDLRRRRGKLAPSRVLGLLRQCCKALAAVHETGVVHRDVKPENLLIQRENGRDALRLVDFGIASTIGSMPRVAGTLLYMAPEQLRGAPVDPRSDLYALACVGFELLAGRPAFARDTNIDIARAQLEEPPPSVLTSCPDLHPAIDAVLQRCLEKDPEARYPDAAALELALCEAQVAADLATDWDDLPLPAASEAQRAELRRRMPANARVHRRTTRRRVAASLAAVGALAVLAAFIPRESSSTSTALAVDDRGLAHIDELVDNARTSAGQAYWAYPPSADPQRPTALTWVQTLETEDGALGYVALLRAAQLRDEFATTLVRLGDRYWDEPHGRSFAVEYYAQALLFDDDHGHARERVGISEVQLAAIDSRVSEGAFLATDLAVADVLAALAEDEHDARRDKVAVLLDKGEGPRAMRTREALTRLVDDDPAHDSEHPRPKSDPDLTSAAAEGEEEDPADPIADQPEGPAQVELRARDLTKLADAAYRRGQRGRARDLYQQAIDLAPHHAHPHAGLAEVLFAQGRYEQARLQASAAVRRSPATASYRLLYGDTLLKTGRVEHAREAYREARDLGSPAAKKRLAQLRGRP